MKKIHICLFAALIMVLAVMPVFATETEAPTETPPAAPVEIRTVEELQQMANDPAGSYILMNDLDMEGVAWKSLDFKGSFDGNGYTIFNLTLSEPGNEMPNSMDGNYKTYETRYVGLFATLQDAQVKDLTLLGLRGLVELDKPCFLGGIAGYMDNSTITGCTVSGILELRAHDRMFGVAGVVGFGKGTVENCHVDVTLICTDTDKETRDEQFMGGVLAAGFAAVRNCEVTINGYCSEYGYCHNGGIVGMMVEYPKSKWCAEVFDNTVAGKITFFEKNPNRRAYCEAVVGENLALTCSIKRNKADFLRDERMTYDVELRPELCEDPVYREKIVPAGCDTYGYTDHTCENCGYTFRDAYRVPVHIPGEYVTVKEATVEEEGMMVATCPCGLEHQQTIEKLPPPATDPTVPETTAPVLIQPEPEPKPEKGPVNPALIGAVAAGAAVLTLVLYLLLGKKKRGGKYSKHK